MYGSLDDETGFGGGNSREDPLLPPREPSTAESRRLRKRISVKRNALRVVAASRRHLGLGPEGEPKPIMKSLFRDDRKKHQRIKSAPLSIETLQELVPNGQTQQQEAPAPRRSSKSQQPPPHQQQDQEQEQAAAAALRQRKHSHSWLYVLLHPNSRHPHAIWYKWFISVIILLDVAFFVASTEEAWNQAHPNVFYYEEGVVSAIFLLEYICRIYVAPESHKYILMKPWQARLQYMGTFSAIIDAASSLPFFLELPTGLALPNLTWIRFFRLLRILKTGSYARSMETVWRVIYYNREILYVALNICILLVLVTAVLMYYLRPKNEDELVDADDFSSLLATMYLSTLMLTGQGGPDGDLPWYTKFVVLLTGFFSVAMFAIPASMLTWGFEAEAERCARKAQKKYYSSELRAQQQQQQQQQQQDDDDNDDEDNNTYSKYVSSSSSSEGDTTDEEYLNIIAGGEDDGGEGGNKGPPEEEVVKKLIRTFQTSDVDASGSLSMDEFIELMTDPALEGMGMVGMATSMGLLAKRVHHLEHELAKSHKKLDQLLEIVIQQQKQKGG